MSSNIAESLTTLETPAYPVATPRPLAVPAGRTAAALYREYGKRVERWALRLGGPGCDAEDAVQEVFALVHAELPRFRGDARLTTWLFAITENVVGRQRRRGKRFSSLRRLLGARVEDAAVHRGRQQPHPLETLEREETSARVYAALDHLREPYRSALILFELEELSGQEIAELKGVPVATVWVWLHRARAKFIEALAAGGGGAAR